MLKLFAKELFLQKNYVFVIFLTLSESVFMQFPEKSEKTSAGHGILVFYEFVDLVQTESG